VNLQISGIACQNAQNRLITGCFGRRVRAARLPSTEKRSVFPAGFWDYLIVEGATGRVFVSHGTEVDVVDSKKGEVTARSSPHEEGGRAFE
jgi:hypothetical protein